MKKNYLLTVLALSGAVILTGCAPEPSPQPTVTPSPTITLSPPPSSTPEPSPSATTPTVTPKPAVPTPVVTPTPEPKEEIPQPEPISTVDGEVELLSTMKPYDGPTPLLDLAASMGMELEYPVGTYLKAYENFEKDPDDSSAYWKIVPENTKYVDVYNSDQDFESRTWNASQIYFRDKGTTKVTFYNIKTNDKIVFTFVIK